jgi:Beta-propeller repeat
MYKEYKLVQAHARDCLREAERARLIRAAREKLEPDSSHVRRILAIIVSTTLMVLLAACGQSPVRETRLEPTTTSNNTYPYYMTHDSAGNIYICGQTAGSFKGFTNAGGFDIVVFKYDNVGNRVWLTQLGLDNYGSSDYEYAYGIAVSDAVYVTGFTGGNLLGQPKYGSDPNDADAYLAQLDINTGIILGVDQ